MANKLSVYRGICRACGERRIDSLTEGVKIRRLIDDVWADDSGVKFCLSSAFWHFAMEYMSLTYSPSVEPAFGYQYAFDKPAGWVRTYVVSNDPDFQNVPYRFDDRGDYWLANDQTIYAKFVSADTTRGMDLSHWSAGFTLYVEHHLASLIVVDLENSRTSKQDLEQSALRYLNRARSTEAMDESARFKPQGAWANARRNGTTSRDGGNTGNLIG